MESNHWTHAGGDSFLFLFGTPRACVRPPRRVASLCGPLGSTVSLRPPLGRCLAATGRGLHASAGRQLNAVFGCCRVERVGSVSTGPDGRGANASNSQWRVGIPVAISRLGVEAFHFPARSKAARVVWGVRNKSLTGLSQCSKQDGQ